MGDHRAARRGQYYRRRYPVPCPHCGRHRKVYPTGFCKACSDSLEIRFCRRCQAVKLIDGRFYPNDHVCRACYKEKRAGA